ncbi:hypothetical protein N7456_011272 [Penicillium angulare]|uniref:Zn(2)-C6 fungal-type domain-containing protein n=1 Tax=Penicillium angulare TaxID=116970 RepID=A0A9W9ETM9_9EURO|nr:hypothetical protein N7456_011272 [Penicillium angulare]
MPRTGVKRVRTGCKTCKVRKIKCDEGKPQCQKCISTGRLCDGYEEPPPHALQRNALLRIQPSQCTWGEPRELRNLECFRQFVAPMLAGPVPAFWTDVVPQLTEREPIARHAMMALSSFFVTIGQDSPPQFEDLKFAQRHYGSAIKQMIYAKPADMDIVVTACILLIGVEFLRGHPEAAIFHTRHVMQLVKSYKPRAELQATLALFNAFILLLPGFFPEMPRPIEYKSSCGVASFNDLTQAKEALTELTSRAVELAFSREEQQRTRLSTPLSESQESIEFLEKRLNEDLDAFYAVLLGLERYDANMKRRGNRLFKARWLVCKVWANDGLAVASSYGSHEYYFLRIIDLVSEAYAEGPKYIFAIEFATILLFVIQQCRDEDISNVALGLFKDACCANPENISSSHPLCVRAKSPSDPESITSA